MCVQESEYVQKGRERSLERNGEEQTGMEYFRKHGDTKRGEKVCGCMNGSECVYKRKRERGT